MNTLSKQKTEHLKLNSDILRGQFDFMGSQYKQIKNEVNQLGKCSANREVKSIFL